MADWKDSVVLAHQKQAWAKGEKWRCTCPDCRAERKRQKEQDRRAVKGIDWIED